MNDKQLKKLRLQLVWTGVGVFTFLLILASIVEWRSINARPSETTLLVNENENPVAAKQLDFADHDSEVAPVQQERLFSSTDLEGSQDHKMATSFEAKSSEKPSVDFLTNPNVVGAEEKLLNIAKRESESEYEHIQDLIRQVRTPGNLVDFGWVAIDRQTTRLSTETVDAYHHWRKAVLDATAAKYSLQDVEATTSGPPEFCSKQAIDAKTHLLNIAAQMGPTDRTLVANAVNNVERDGTGWSSSDRLMDKVQLDTILAYRRWKDAVWSAP